MKGQIKEGVGGFYGVSNLPLNPLLRKEGELIFKAAFKNLVL
jgi:hypothetical protein